MQSSRAKALLLLLLVPTLAHARAAQAPPGNRGAAKDAADDPAPGETVGAARAPILVNIDAGRKVFIGKEQAGTTDDVGPLKERVREAIESRRQAARARGDEEAAESAGTVFICAPPEMRYRDVVKVVDAIREAGGEPTGLSSGCQPPRREPDA